MRSFKSFFLLANALIMGGLVSSVPTSPDTVKVDEPVSSDLGPLITDPKAGCPANPFPNFCGKGTEEYWCMSAAGSLGSFCIEADQCKPEMNLHYQLCCKAGQTNLLRFPGPPPQGLWNEISILNDCEIRAVPGGKDH